MPKSIQNSLAEKWYFQNSPKVTLYLGYFWKKVTTNFLKSPNLATLKTKTRVSHQANPLQLWPSFGNEYLKWSHLYFIGLLLDYFIALLLDYFFGLLHWTTSLDYFIGLLHQTTIGLLHWTSIGQRYFGLPTLTNLKQWKLS